MINVRTDQLRKILSVGIEQLRKSLNVRIEQVRKGGLPSLEVQEVFHDVPAFRVLLVKELRMKLNAVEPASFLLHSLDPARLV